MIRGVWLAKERKGENQKLKMLYLVRIFMQETDDAQAKLYNIWPENSHRPQQIDNNNEILTSQTAPIKKPMPFLVRWSSKGKIWDTSAYIL